MKLRSPAAPIALLAISALALTASAGRTSAPALSYESVTSFANRTPHASAIVIAAAGSQRMIGGEGLDWSLPGAPFVGPPTSFFIGEGSGAAPADIDAQLDSMTVGERIQWLEETLPTLRDVHDALQAFRGNVRPTDLVQNAAGPDGAGIGFVLRETYKLLKALELTRDIPGLEQIGRARRFASALDGITLLLDNLIEREENGETIGGDDLRDLADWMGDLETSLGLLGSLGSVNPVVSAMLSVYGGALDATAEVIDEVIVPYFQRLSEARQVAEEALGTVESAPFEGVDEGVDELGSLIADLEDRLETLRGGVDDAEYHDVENAKINAFRSLGIDATEYEDLRDEWLEARHRLNQVLAWFDGIETLRVMAQQALLGLRGSRHETFREELDRYQAAYEAKQAQMAEKLDELEDAYDAYQQAFQAFMSVNDEIVNVLRRYARSADPDDDSPLGGQQFLNEHFPELFRWKWTRRWIPDFIRSRREQLDGASDEPIEQEQEPTDVVDITERPELVATTGEDLEGPGPDSGTGPVLVASIRATGTSTGPGAFDINIANMGKPVRVVGDFPVFRPATEAETETLRSLAERMSSVASAANVVEGGLGGYCLDKELEPPASGEYYVLATAAEQRAFAPLRRILVAARELYDAGALHPDSDPGAYYHSIRQWTVWTDQHGYDESAFTEAFVAFTRKNVEASGEQWTEAIETTVRQIAPNRFADIQSVLREARDGTTV